MQKQIEDVNKERVALEEKEKKLSILQNQLTSKEQALNEIQGKITIQQQDLQINFKEREGNIKNSETMLANRKI